MTAETIPICAYLIVIGPEAIRRFHLMSPDWAEESTNLQLAVIHKSQSCSQQNSYADQVTNIPCTVTAWRPLAVGVRFPPPVLHFLEVSACSAFPLLL